MWMSDSASFANQLVISACLHGLLFLTLEVVISWLEERGRKTERENKTNKEYLETFKKMRYDQVSATLYHFSRQFEQVVKIFHFNANRA